MHRCASQIIVITNTDNIWIAELIIKQGIRKRTIAIIGRP